MTFDGTMTRKLKTSNKLDYPRRQNSKWLKECLNISALHQRTYFQAVHHSLFLEVFAT